MPSTIKQPASALHAKRSPPRARLSDGLERLQAIAKKQGGVCLTEQYEGVHARYTFVCAQGHQWSTAGTNILYVDTWCRICCFEQGLNTQKHPQGLERLQEMAAKHGGVCMSEHYTGLNGRYTCRCTQGHTWSATGQSLMKGHWCKTCGLERMSVANTRADGWQHLRTAAAQHGGACLAESYTNLSAHYAFRCAKDHTWHTTGAKILLGHWCPRCANTQRGKARRLADGFAQLQSAAAEHGGTCLSETYRGIKKAYTFRCREGHEWEAFGYHLLQGNWCRRCYLEKRRLGIEVARQLAIERGGQCLSDTYRRTTEKLIWQCGHGHVWHASLASVRSKGSWCPECAIINRITNPNSKSRWRLGNKK